MRKVILYIATSLDNFIAKKDGDTSWLQDPEITIPNEDYGYYDMLNSIDTVIMGNSSYQEILRDDETYPYVDKNTFVFKLSRDHQTQQTNKAYVNTGKQVEREVRTKLHKTHKIKKKNDGNWKNSRKFRYFLDLALDFGKWILDLYLFVF